MKSFFFFLFILLLVLNVSGFTSLGAPGGLLPNQTLASGVVQNDTLDRIHIDNLHTAGLTINNSQIQFATVSHSTITYGGGELIHVAWQNCTSSTSICSFSFGANGLYTRVQPSNFGGTQAVIWTTSPSSAPFWWASDMLPNANNHYAFGTNTLAWKNITAYNYTFGGRNDVGIYLDNSTSPNNTAVLTGNFVARGNITSASAFVPVYLFTHTNHTLPVLGANLWTNVTFPLDYPTEPDEDIKFGWIHNRTDTSNHTFTVLFDGIYDIDYDYDIQNTGAPANLNVAGRVIYVNGTELIGSVFEEGLATQNTETELSHDFLVRLNARDVIIFQFISDGANVELSTHHTFGDQPESVSARIFKIAN